MEFACADAKKASQDLVLHENMTCDSPIILWQQSYAYRILVALHLHLKLKIENQWINSSLIERQK